MLTLDEIAFLMVLTGSAIVLVSMWMRNRHTRECVKCGQRAVFPGEAACRACFAFQSDFHLFER
jgi:DNA-binding IclR family transcriptional regulator